MKLTLTVEVKRSEGPKIDNPEIADGLRDEVDNIDLWIEDSNYNVVVADIDYPAGES